MNRMTATALHRNTNAVLARVEGGEPVEITLTGRPVARIVPAGTGNPLLDQVVCGRPVDPGHPHRPDSLASAKCGPVH
jgi:prevent-host-death family protein